MTGCGHHDGVTAGAGPRPGLRALLAQPTYRRLWTARTISQVGDVAQFTTLALLVVMLTGSACGGVIASTGP